MSWNLPSYYWVCLGEAIEQFLRQVAAELALPTTDPSRAGGWRDRLIDACLA
jgi:hypothetical protein